MRVIAAVAMGWFLLCHGSFRTLRADPPLNILLLYADDWRHDSLGCAGNPVVQTPQLDELARQGVRFTDNYATTSICGVSRATLLTGQWMSRHGNRGFEAFQTPWAQTYPEILRGQGYFVGHVGKWYTGPVHAESFDFMRITRSKYWSQRPDGTRVHVTRQNEQDALEFLRQRPAEKPFCLTVAFSAVHAEDAHPLQYLPQPESLKLYQDVSIPVPRTAGDDFFHRLPSFIANEKNEGRHRWHWRFDTPERFQEYVKNYYRLISEVDATCGRLLEEIDRQGQRGRTLVIFTTDNGYFLGEHGLADKWYPYEESVRIPLIIRDPRMPETKQGTSCDAITLNVDLAPTMLAAAKSPIPQTMQGRDLAPLYLKGIPPDWRTDFFYEHGTIRNKTFIPSSEALISKEWKYILWPEFQTEELFHLTDDPFEEQNLIDEAADADQLKKLRARFKTLQAAAK